MPHVAIPLPRTPMEGAADLPAPVETLPAIDYSSVWKVNLQGETAVRNTVRALAEVTLFGVKSHRIATAMRALHACLPENRSFPELVPLEVPEVLPELVHL